MIKKILLGLGVLIALLLVAAVSIPYFFKDEILAKAKAGTNEGLKATVDFKDVDISLFRHFPRLSVGLTGLSITGKDQFEGVRLLACDRLDLAVDLMSALFGDEVKIKSVFLDKPDLRVFVLPDGTANYDITAPADPKAPATKFKATLDRYEIRDGHFRYEDRGLGMVAELDHLNHSGRGEFTEDIYDLAMTTKANSLTLDYGGTRYLVKAKTDWEATLNMDMTKSKYTFKQNSLKINDLDVNLDGWVAMPNDDDINMDLKFSAPSNAFKDFLSLVPGAYTKDFAGVQASGQVRLAGFAKGTYNEKSYPAFALDFGIAGGNFKYPALPMGVSGIDVDCKIKSPGSTLAGLAVDIPKFSMKVGANPISGHFFLKDPMTDPDVDLALKGILNLGDLSKAFPMEGVKTLAGLVNADVFMKARQSQIEAKAYEAMNMGGSFKLDNLRYEAVGTPPVVINSAAASISPGRVDLPEFDAKLGKSDLRMSGVIDQPLAFFVPKKTMTGSLTMRSFFFDANEWMAPEPEASAATATPSTTVSPAEKTFDRWDFTLDGEFKKLLYDTYTISDLTTKGHFTPNRMDVENFGLKIGNSDLAGSGQILNAWNYLFENQTVSGNIELRSGFFDMNQFMTEEPATGAKTAASTTAPATAEEPFVVPTNWDFILNADFGKLRYDNLDLENLTGKVVVKNGVASLQETSARTLGGGISLAGSYDSRDAAKPAFDMDFGLKEMGFRSAFDNFVTVKKLAPIAQLIDGKFNTTLKMKGRLGKDMSPDLTTLTADGFLQTLDAVLKGWKPLDEIGDKLNADFLRSSLDLKNTKNWFEIRDGKVTIKPFDLNVRDIAMNIGGSHGIAQDMDYKILAKVPRKSLEKTGVGAAASRGFDWAVGEAGKKGVNIRNGEWVNIRFLLGGSLFSPKIKAEFAGTDGQSVQSEVQESAAAVAEKAKDSLRTVAQKELEKGKKAASDMAKRAADSLENVARKKAEEAAKVAAQKAAEAATKAAGKEVGDAVGKEAGKKVGDAADKVLKDEKAKKAAEKAGDKLKNWDPLKKKN